MSGYSGTPLPQKLGIKTGFRVRLINVPTEVRHVLRTALAACEEAREGQGALDFVLMFVPSAGELSREFGRVSKLLAPRGMIWVGWAKRSFGSASELDGNRVREIGLTSGLVDVKVCAITETWSGLKFVRRASDRGVS
jgi:hypothetical protein